MVATPETIRREFIYLWYYFTIQFEQIFLYWLIGMAAGSAVSVFGKERINRLFAGLGEKRLGLLGVVPACVLGIASPLCMYGTIPVAASFSQKGVRDDLLASFMAASILLNPQLIVYSAALGPELLFIRIASCFICGAAAGILVRIFYRDKPFFDFSGFAPQPGRGGSYGSSDCGGYGSADSGADCGADGGGYGSADGCANANADASPGASTSSGPGPGESIALRLLKNFGRNAKATGPFFLLGVLLSAAFQRYVPADALAGLFGRNRGFGLLLAATVGVPMYVCGGGTIPLLLEWLQRGMSAGAAAAFMISGPAMKITNIGALKIILGAKHFALYIMYCVFFAIITGVLVDLLFAFK